ncbi:MAG TPA: hypothetical protein PKC24_02880 [Cyclobacteriaceae bacterium]|nr:hypothetical protein [Cyclobacteriaceae bacterium]
MKNFNMKWLMMAVMIFSLTSCILEDVEPEYDIIGGVGTIATLTASTTSPTGGATVTFTLTIYSEHVDAKELRMNRVQGATVTNLQTKTYASWNREDSVLETFQFQVPAGTAGTSIVIQFQLVSASDHSVTRNITLNVQT